MTRPISHQLAPPGSLSDRDALVRMVQYAQIEAIRQNEKSCAGLLAAALQSLDAAPEDSGPGGSLLTGR